MKKNCAQELEVLAEKIGEFIQYWGFKKIHGKIWVHLFLAKNGLCATQLREKLGVSKALISMSLKELMEYDVITIKGKSSQGNQLYVADIHIAKIITQVINKRERIMLLQISQAQQNLTSFVGKSNPCDIDGDRVVFLAKLIKNAQLGVDAVLKLQTICFSRFFDNEN